MADHVGRVCVIAAVEELLASRDELVVLDGDGYILSEYRAKARLRGAQPGPTEFFLRWLQQNAANRRCVRTVPLERDADGEFIDFPRDAELAAFDRDDRVYVAVAVTSGLRPVIINATDSDWAPIAPILVRRYGIRVRTIC
jgi:hypothetical protein